MAWEMVGRPISTADAAAATPTISQKFQIPSTLTKGAILKGVGLPLIYYNNPAFSSVTLELWSDRGGSPQDKIGESNHSWTKTQIQTNVITTEAHGVVYMGFEFDELPLRPGVVYHLALRIGAYTGDETTFLAWKHVHPDPAYTTGLTLEVVKAGISPLEAVIFAAEAA